MTSPFPKVRKAEVEKPEERKPLTRKQFAELLLRQEGRCGCGCGERLQADQIVDEHLVPLDCLGSNDISNRALYRKACAQRKTDEEDKPRSAKGRRLREEAGQLARRKKHGSFFRKPKGYVSRALDMPDNSAPDYDEWFAKTLLDAFLSALSREGMVVVPREPSEEMMRVARAYLGFSPDERPGDALPLRLSMWREMIAVAEAEAKRAALQHQEEKPG